MYFKHDGKLLPFSLEIAGIANNKQVDSRLADTIPKNDRPYTEYNYTLLFSLGIIYIIILLFVIYRYYKMK